MDAERLFWMTHEFIKDTLADMPDKDIIAIEHTLPEDAVLAFDIDEILESLPAYSGQLEEEVEQQRRDEKNELYGPRKAYHLENNND